MLKVGAVIDGKYKILSKIGQGGMSVVYLAINERSNKTWAVKEVRKDGIYDFAAVYQSLMTEIHILKNLSHKYLPSIADIIDDDEAYLIVMDYIQGKTLLELMTDTAFVMTVEDAIRWMYQLCDVLHYLHSLDEPVIYRDMKPANIMIKPDGDITLIDFGTARIFKRGHIEDTTCLGTPGYAAPEQYGGSGQTRPQTDIYCLGATMHHLITGRNPAATPFQFPKITECNLTLINNKSSEQMDRILGLETVIEKCTQYDAKDRYASCAEVRNDLDHLEKLGMPYKKKMRHRYRVVCGSLIMAVLCGVLWVLGIVLTKYTEMTGYGYYMENAQISGTPVEMYTKAIALDPAKPEAYIALLETMTGDAKGFDTGDDEVMTSILYSKSTGRIKDNKSYLQENVPAYIYFAYKLACAYYTANGGVGDKGSAAAWFEIVNDADLESLSFGADIDVSQMQARSEILGRICTFYKSNMIGKLDDLGDSVYGYDVYWHDLMSLLERDVAGKDTVVMELNLYREIIYQIYTKTLSFKLEAGIGYLEMQDALTDIEKRILNLDSSIEHVNALKALLMENMDLVKQSVALVFEK